MEIGRALDGEELMPEKLRKGYSGDFVDKVAYIMEYERQWELTKTDLLESDE